MIRAIISVMAFGVTLIDHYLAMVVGGSVIGGIVVFTFYDYFVNIAIITETKIYRKSSREPIKKKSKSKSKKKLNNGWWRKLWK